jgi:hypothetical protein
MGSLKLNELVNYKVRDYQKRPVIKYHKSRLKNSEYSA